MNLREVTIGRARGCDIYLDPRCQFASNRHAVIYYDGSQLMFRDISTNGTLINNVNVHKRAVPINHGDSIMIAGKYPLNWNQIDAFFLPMPQQPRSMGTMLAQPAPVASAAATQGQPNLSKWNWGAFFLNWIWGLFNGCWWLLPLYILIIVCCFIPIINFFTGLLSLALTITCGVKGNAWAWENKKWISVQDFEETQSLWTKIGLAWFCLSIIATVISLWMFMSAISGLFSSLI